MLKKVSSDNINSTKNALFLLSRAPLITVLLSIRNSNRSTLFISLNLCVGFSNFNSASFLLNFIFLFNNKHGLHSSTPSPLPPTPPV